VALTPDGKTVAVGGVTVADGQEEGVYLFDRETGQLKQHLSGLSARAAHLAYSKDGRYLSVTLGATSGSAGI
jgi:hypothetical protein